MRKGQKADRPYSLNPNIPRNLVKEVAEACGKKLCSSCDQIKELSEFSKNEHRCKVCCVIRRTVAGRKERTGFTQEEYEALLIEQDGRCAICRRPDPHRALSADHCHKTGQKRKLLCSECNFMLSKAQDSPDLLRRAADYLLGIELDLEWELPEDHTYVSLPPFVRKEERQVDV